MSPYNQRWEITMRDINSADGGAPWPAFASDDPDIQPGTVATYGDGFQAVVTNGGVYLEGSRDQGRGLRRRRQQRGKRPDSRVRETRKEVNVRRACPPSWSPTTTASHAPGCWRSSRQLEPIGEVVVLAPERNWSAASHAKTMHKPLRIYTGRRWPTAVQAYTSSGSPTDCVALVMGGVLGVKPDLVVSGINTGHNVGIDITYSGTVACAMEAVIKGVPGVAVSTCFPGDSQGRHRPGAPHDGGEWRAT